MISIISVTYNSSGIVEKAIRPFLNNDDFEIFVVDNKSTDNTIDMLHSVKANNLTVIANKKNIGYGAANNMAIKKSRGEFILFLNPDGEIDVKSTQRLAEITSSNEKIGIIQPKLTNNPSEIGISSEILELVKKDYIIFAIALIKRSVLDNIGLFDEKIFMYHEDLDMCKRLIDNGFDICIANNIKSFHAQGSSSKPSLKVTAIKESEREISRIYFKTKHQKRKKNKIILQYFLKYLTSSSINLGVLRFHKSLISFIRLIGVLKSIKRI